MNSFLIILIGTVLGGGASCTGKHFVVRIRRLLAAAPPLPRIHQIPLPGWLVVLVMIGNVYLCAGVNRPIEIEVAVLAFVWQIWVLAFIDARTAILPNEFTLSVMLSGLLWHVLLQSDHLPTLSHCVAMLLGYGIPVCLNLIYRAFNGLEAIGLGDAKLLAGLGLWTGLAPLADLVLMSLVLLLVYTGGYFLLCRRRLMSVPLGPFLAAAGNIWIVTNV